MADIKTPIPLIVEKLSSEQLNHLVGLADSDGYAVLTHLVQESLESLKIESITQVPVEKDSYLHGENGAFHRGRRNGEYMTSLFFGALAKLAGAELDRRIAKKKAEVDNKK